MGSPQLHTLAQHTGRAWPRIGTRLPGCHFLVDFYGAMATGGWSFTTISGPWGSPAGGWSGPAVAPQAQDLTVPELDWPRFWDCSCCGVGSEIANYNMGLYHVGFFLPLFLLPAPADAYLTTMGPKNSGELIEGCVAYMFPESRYSSMETREQCDFRYSSCPSLPSSLCRPLSCSSAPWLCSRLYRNPHLFQKKTSFFNAKSSLFRLAFEQIHQLHPPALLRNLQRRLAVGSDPGLIRPGLQQKAHHLLNVLKERLAFVVPRQQDVLKSQPQSVRELSLGIRFWWRLCSTHPHKRRHNVRVRQSGAMLRHEEFGLVVGIRAELQQHLRRQRVPVVHHPAPVTRPSVSERPLGRPLETHKKVELGSQQPRLLQNPIEIADLSYCFLLKKPPFRSILRISIEMAAFSIENSAQKWPF